MPNRRIARWGTIAIASAALALTGCAADAPGGSSTTEGGAAAPAPGEVAGFEEFEVGPAVEVGPLNVAAVYFQPVDMYPAGMGLSAADADIHIEADVTALAANELGFGAGDWVPNMTVDYQITNPAGQVAEGTCMPMNASDGPHYGANIVMGDAGTYKVKFILHSPEENGHLVHTDKATGVEGKFWETPLEAAWDFNYIPREW